MARIMQVSLFLGLTVLANIYACPALALDEIVGSEARQLSRALGWG